MKDIWQLFYVFLKIGTFTFGGGYAMIPAIKRETSEDRSWIGEKEISDCIALCQSLPGAFAVNAAIYIGRKVKGTAGALAACFGMVFPAFLSILAILMFLGRIEDNVYVIGAFEGIKAASVALIQVTVYQMGRNILKKVSAYIIAAISFSLIIFLGVSAVWAVVMGGLYGYFEYSFRKRKGGEQR